MQLKYKPVIVVVAYNRPRSLERILSSLLRLKNASDVKLVVSIDHKAPDNYDVLEIARQFVWPFGEKEVVYQEKQLGLRKHIIQCADLSLKYGSIIILEDDLYVSPYFYDYACQALDYYSDEPEIAGISLYNQTITELSELPFAPINDESDVYFLQHPSSWGQAWSSEHWIGFKNWYQDDPDLFKIDMPDPIRLTWPETSWKKYFCGYMAEKRKYFAYPRISFTTNFNDPGTNYKLSVNHEGQTQLRIFGGPYKFKALSDSFSKYDSHLELIPESLKQLTSAFDEFEIELDLYGTKAPGSIKSPFVISSKPSLNPLKGYKRALKPHEMNVILELPGDDFCLSRTADILTVRNKNEWKISNYKYFYTRKILGFRILLFSYYQRFFKK